MQAASVVRAGRRALPAQRDGTPNSVVAPGPSSSHDKHHRGTAVVLDAGAKQAAGLQHSRPTKGAEQQGRSPTMVQHSFWGVYFFCFDSAATHALGALTVVEVVQEGERLFGCAVVPAFRFFFLRHQSQHLARLLLSIRNRLRVQERGLGLDQ